MGINSFRLASDWLQTGVQTGFRLASDGFRLASHTLPHTPLSLARPLEGATRAISTGKFPASEENMKGWSLKSDKHAYFEGKSPTPTKLAAKVCSIVMGHGGRFVQ
jgi:hypothetical protein